MTDVTVRPLRASDLATADRLFRLAFGTFIGLPDPARFAGDSDYVRVRFQLDPDAAFGAEVGGELVGSNFATNWGSVGFFGPLTVRPDLWNAGVASRLLAPTMDCFARWGTRHAGLFTFAQSPKHVHLYEKFGFAPRFLTAIMAKTVGAGAGTSDDVSRRRVAGGAAAHWSALSTLGDGERQAAIGACRALADAVHEGLDPTREIAAVLEHAFGDTVLVWHDADLVAFAVCHCGPGTEAGGGTCYAKFAAARPGGAASAAFAELLDACEAFAGSQGASRLVAGVNSARREAYAAMRARGFRSEILGVAMQRPDEPAYNRSGVYVIDDWR